VALARADEVEIDHSMGFLRDYAERNISSPGTRKKFLVSRNVAQQNELLEQEQEREELNETALARNQSYLWGDAGTCSSLNREVGGAIPDRRMG
jgi:hypothetical protein